MGQSDTLIRVDMSNTFFNAIKSILVGLVVGAIAIVAVALVGIGIGAAAAAIMTAFGGAIASAGITFGTGAAVLATGAGLVSGLVFFNSQESNDEVFPIYSLSPEEIFEGKILLFDVDFFNPVTEIHEKLDDEGNLEYYYYDAEGKVNDESDDVPTSKQNTAADLQAVISQWYSALRNIALVLSMSVLLYIGIRMLLSSVAQDKAKYKQMLMDWFISICLLFFMHYIMAFSVSIVNELTNILVYQQETDPNNAKSFSTITELDKDGKIEEKLKEVGREDVIQDGTKPTEDGGQENTRYAVWPTNLMGQLRVAAQKSYGDASYVGYSICFFVLTLLTLFFIFTYLKRVLYMAFLTMIAPLVALTYPIDKISDGEAQAFNKWLKEYIFNLLIQPLHLIIYTVLVSSAFELAGENVIYSLVAIAFLIPAEKLMRSFFGFEKAATPPSLAGAAVGGSIVNQGLNKLLGKGPQGSKGNSGKSGNDSESTSKPLRMGFKDNGSSAIDNVSNEMRNNQSGANELPEGSRLYSPGGASAADALQTSEDPVRRAEREALEERIADGQMTEDELTAEQRELLGLGIRTTDIPEEINETGPENPNRNDTGSEGANRGETGRGVRRIKNAPRGIAALGKGLGAAGKQSAVHYARNFKKGMDIKEGLKKSSKLVTGATIGATAGAVGLGLGLATGDPSNAATYALGAATAGATFGAGTAGAGIGALSRTTSASREAFKRAYYGDRYDQHKAEKNMKEWKKDPENRTAIEEHLGQKEAKELYESGRINNYLKNDISDPKLIVAMEKAMAEEQGQGGNVNFNDMLLASEAREVYGNGKSRLGGKAREELGKDYASQFEKRGISAEKAQKSADKIADRVDTINRIYSKL